MPAVSLSMPRRAPGRIKGVPAAAPRRKRYHGGRRARGVSLRGIPFKEEYRADRDDIIGEFIAPCLDACVRYDRCSEYISLRSLGSLSRGRRRFASNGASLRIVCGHRFTAADLSFASKLEALRRSGRKGGGRDAELDALAGAHRVRIKVAVPNSDLVDGAFTEKVGIFTDGAGDAVAFTGGSHHTFDAMVRNFESIDVFTSWDDASRVDKKVADFEELWADKTRHIDVYDFEHAERNNMIKFSPEWALEEE